LLGYDSNNLTDGDFRFWARRPAIFQANALYLLAAAGVTAIPYALSFVASLFGAKLGEQASMLATSLLYYPLLIGLPIFRYAWKRDGVTRSLRLNPLTPGMALVSALAALAGVMTALSVGSLWMLALEGMGARLTDQALPRAESTGQLVALVAASCMLPGIFEELLFRGFILGAWERRGTKNALAVSTAMFAALHGSITGLPTQILLGFAIGYLVVNTDSLYAGMIYHTTHNFALVMLSQYQKSTAKAGQTLYESAGGAAGVLLLALQVLVYGGIFMAILAVSGWHREKQGRTFEQIERIDRTPLGWQELLVLLAAAITVGSMYLMDLLRLMRVI
jgi:membrane protease YdiL (CAAX protease family)